MGDPPRACQVTDEGGRRAKITEPKTCNWRNCKRANGFRNNFRQSWKARQQVWSRPRRRSARARGGRVRVRRAAGLSDVVRSDGGGRRPLAATPALLGVRVGGAGGAEDPATATAAEQGQGVERRPDIAGFQSEGQPRLNYDKLKWFVRSPISSYQSSRVSHEKIKIATKIFPLNIKKFPFSA